MRQTARQTAGTMQEEFNRVQREKQERTGEDLKSFRESYPYCREPKTCNGSCRREIACNN